MREKMTIKVFGSINGNLKVNCGMLDHFQFFGLVFILDKFIFYQREKTLSSGLKKFTSPAKRIQRGQFLSKTSWILSLF